VPKKRMSQQAPAETTNPNPPPMSSSPDSTAAALPNPSPLPSSPTPLAAVTARLNDQLKELRLPTFREQFQTLAEQAMREGLSYPHYLAELTSRECQTRNHSRVQRLLRNSRLLPGKTWEQFSWSRVPLQVARQLQSLRDGTFLERRENLLVFGKPGSGKTHLLAALGEQLVRQGRSVLFTTCSLLVQELLAAKGDLKLERFIKRLAAFEALIIDDLGYVQQSREEMEVLFTLLAERYERGSVLLTSNLPFSQWEQIFKDPMTTAAAIDRLVHHSIIIELNIPSYRLETAKNQRQTSPEVIPAPAAP
jgi:DNA replication protein DnaC